MSLQTWQETLVPQPGALSAAGTLFNTYTTAKTVLPAGCLYTLPPNWWYVGRMLRMTILGAESHRVTGPDTMTFQLMMGSNVAFSSGALNLTTTVHTTIPFRAVCEVTCRAVGTSGNLMGQWSIEGQGFAMAASLADNAAGTGYAMGPNTAPAVGSNFDTTQSQVIDFWVAQSFSGAGNGIQVQQALVEALN